MKIKLFFFNYLILFFFDPYTASSKNRFQNSLQLNKRNLVFTENKGQVCNQYHQPRKDVLYYGCTEKGEFHITRQGISYQFFKITKNKFPNTSDKLFSNNSEANLNSNPITVSRVDNVLLNCNQTTKITTNGMSKDYKNYYLDFCEEGAALEVRDFNSIVFSEIYEKTDLKYYSSNGNLKYDFIVKPGGDYKKIKISVKGAKKIYKTKAGSIFIETDNGYFTEEPPIVYQSGRIIKSCWILDGNTLSFLIDVYDSNKELIIDPMVRVYGRYFGGTYDDVITSSTSNFNREILVSGYTNSSSYIATSGAFQVNFGSPPFSYNKDAFFAKFDSLGNRIWATYYGDSDPQTGDGCAFDNLGNLYACGSAQGTGTYMATPGAFQVNPGGGYLAKFSANGTRLWSTQYNGINLSCAVDISGAIILYGKTGNPNGISTPGAYQPFLGGGLTDCFLAKFDSLGSRLWGTFYGGDGIDEPGNFILDSNKNIYVCGSTQSRSGTVYGTNTSYQSSIGGNSDAFLAKFDSLGQKLWSTYYGGTGFDWGASCTTDVFGNLYLIGTASNGTVFSSIGCNQPSFGGGSSDIFLAKFNNNGLRLWGTFYGGNGDETGVYTFCKGNCVLICATTISSNSLNISTPGALQPNPGSTNSYDAIMASFDLNGSLNYGSFFGGSGYDKATSCLIDLSGNFYLTGFTTSTNNIASVGVIQDTAMGFFDSYLEKFQDCSLTFLPINITPISNQTICSFQNATLSALGNGSINWYSSNTQTNSIFSGSILVTNTLSTGIYTFYAAASNCTANSIGTAVTLTVLPIPTITVLGNDTVCIGSSPTYTAIGANNYNWNGLYYSPFFTFSINSNTTIACTGYNQSGCSSTVIKNITADPCTILKEFDFNNDMSIYPNPIDKDFIINSNTKALIKIFNELGSLIFEGNINKGNNYFNQFNFAKGLYSILVNDGNNFYLKKIIVN